MNTIRVLAVAAIFAGCGHHDPVSPEPAPWVQVTPPAAFSTFWQEMTACTGLSGDYSEITWYRTVMLGDPTTGTTFDGEYHHDQRAIVLRDRVWESRHAPTVLHEMIHALDADRGLWEHSYPTGGGGLQYTPSYDAWHDCTRHFDAEFANVAGW